MPGTVWDSAHKSANITLGRSDIAAAGDNTAGTWKAARATTSLSTGKKYLEYYVAGFNSDSGLLFGFGNSSINLSSYVGSDANSMGFQPDGGGSGAFWWENNSNTTFYSNISNPRGLVVAIAIDLDNKLVWLRTSLSANWNGSGTANPATGTGGKSYSITGALFPVMSAVSGNKADILHINAGGFTFAIGAPSGFSAWDATTPTVGGIGGTSGPTTFDPSNKDAAVALTSGNLTATQNTTSDSFKGVKSTSTYDGGQVYVEFTITTLSAGNSKRGWIAGLAGSGTSVASYPGSDATAIGFQQGDQNDIIWSASNIGTFDGSQTQGDVYGVAIDFNRGLWWVKNVTTNSNWNHDASADPVSGLFGFAISVLTATYLMWAGARSSGSPDAATLNVGASTFVGSIPSGYIAWDAPSSDINASVSKTLGSLAITATVSLDPQYKVTKTLGALTASATATNGIGISLAKTLGSLTVQATAFDSFVQGSLFKTLGSLTCSATGGVSREAEVNQTLGSVSLNASAYSSFKNLEVSKTLDPLVSTARAGVISGQTMLVIIT